MLDLLLHFASMILVPAFLIGMVGSAVVVVITIALDIHEFTSDDAPAEAPQERLKTPAASA